MTARSACTGDALRCKLKFTFVYDTGRALLEQKIGVAMICRIPPSEFPPREVSPRSKALVLAELNSHQELVRPIWTKSTPPQSTD